MSNTARESDCRRNYDNSDSSDTSGDTSDTSNNCNCRRNRRNNRGCDRRINNRERNSNNNNNRCSDDSSSSDNGCRNDIRNIDFYEDRSDRCKEDREAIEKLTTEETIEDVTVKENNDIKERSL